MLEPALRKTHPVCPTHVCQGNQLVDSTIIFFTVNQLHKKLKYYTEYKNRPEQGNTLSYIAGKRKAEDWPIKGKKKTKTKNY